MGQTTVQKLPKGTSIVSPVLIRNGNDWIYSVDKPERIILSVGM